MALSQYRWQCSVPGCRCTHGADRPMDQPSDWALCRNHWPLVPRRLKAMIRRAWKRYDSPHQFGWQMINDGEAYHRLCRLAVRKACERALGIG